MTVKKATGKTSNGKHSATIAAKRGHTSGGGNGAATMENRRKDRRATERRSKDEPVAVEHRQLERRVKVNRRRQIDPTTCERDYTVQEIEFMNALDEYKRRSGRMFPTCSEVLEVIRGLGYEKREATVVSPLAVLDMPIPSPANDVSLPTA